jgi:metallo-beta-lactamase family protein
VAQRRVKDAAPGWALTFCGATGTVTGSKYLVHAGGRSILVDCGLFQGYKQLRLRNWAQPPFDPARLDAVILTHAHIDHSGYLPLLARKGFKGRIMCSHATRELLGVMLPDAAHLQEEEARYANRHQTSKHHPALPLFDMEDAARALRLVHGVDYLHDTPLEGGLRFRLTPNGHILGSACVNLHAGGRDILFSGDLGRPNDALMAAPARPEPADWLVLESTYGDRLHNPEDTAERLARIVSSTAARGGVVVIPAFAVGRAQSLLLHLYRLRQAGRIGDIPVFLNSPMAADATAIFRGHQEELRPSAEEIRGMCRMAHLVNSADESRALNRREGPMVIISASGMATGGRVLYHLEHFAPDARNTILFAGFQAGGTRGASMLGGEGRIKIHGQYIPVRAEVQSLDNLSSHADYAEILVWLRALEKPPRKVFITHGEPAAADSLRRRVSEALGWDCVVPDYLERVSFG